MGKIIGIDLGTTNSCIAYLREGGEVEIINNSNGGRTTPSVVAFSESGEILVGESAKNQIVLNYDRSISSIKREMGTTACHTRGLRVSKHSFSLYILLI